MSNKYLIFPFALLHYPKERDFEEKLNIILDYCICEYGIELEIPEAEYLKKLKRKEKRFIDIQLFNTETTNRIILSRNDLGIINGSLRKTIEKHNEALEIIKSFKCNIPKVAIHKELFFDVMDKNALSEVENRLNELETKINEYSQKNNK